MKLVLFDNIDAENINALKNSKFIENAEFFSVETVDVSSLSNYEKIDLFVGLTLNFFSQNFMSFVGELNKAKFNEKINILIVESLSDNAKPAIDWLLLCNSSFELNLSVVAELSKETFADDLASLENRFDKSSIAENKVVIYTDGACSGNPGAGGWGAILMTDSKAKEISGFDAETTNNKMELTAVIKALELLKKPCTVDLYSDSAYVVNALNLGWLKNWKANGWKGSDKKAVKNIELWQALDNLLAVHNVNFIKVKGHADNKFNNRCDELATGEIAKHANQD